ncbi:DUF3667 domain-containing protein [Brevundimonas aurifodinae]|uniref:DUF3667 domain-containing protein n=2 Tax=Brevundimonas TaxID=41275 RepID=A0ABV1NM95_9CAUL|nr:MAG: hypothetical protein B7Z42_08810 [Brevundimonas sp. 12-68-7]OYX34576.1 MAG: hypothetical protein B7Z01_05280 [Brevundimonas subvibrioides]
MTIERFGDCPACDLPLMGRYCHGCGQDTRIRPRPIRELVDEAISEVSLVDGPIARTVAALAVRPARLLDAYRRGASSLYVTPLKLFVAVTALFLATMNLTGTTLYQYTWKVDAPGQPLRATYDREAYEVHIEGATERDRWLQPHVDVAIDPEVTAALSAAAAVLQDAEEREAMRYELVSNEEELRMTERLSAWLPNVLWLLMPLYALGLIPLFGRRRLFVEHLIFAMWAHAVAFLLAMGMAALNARGANLNGGLLAVPYLVYFTLAASRYYDMAWWSALWRGLAHMVFYVCLVLLPTAFAVYATVMDWQAFWVWMQA